MALLKGIPSLLIFLFWPKMIEFLRDLTPPNDQQLEEKISRVQSELVWMLSNFFFHSKSDIMSWHDSH